MTDPISVFKVFMHGIRDSLWKFVHQQDFRCFSVLRNVQRSQIFVPDQSGIHRADSHLSGYFVRPAYRAAGFEIFHPVHIGKMIVVVTSFSDQETNDKGFISMCGNQITFSRSQPDPPDSRVTLEAKPSGFPDQHNKPEQIDAEGQKYQPDNQDQQRQIPDCGAAGFRQKEKCGNKDQRDRYGIFHDAALLKMAKKNIEYLGGCIAPETARVLRIFIRSLPLKALNKPSGMIFRDLRRNDSVGNGAFHDQHAVPSEFAWGYDGVHMAQCLSG